MLQTVATSYGKGIGSIVSIKSYLNDGMLSNVCVTSAVFWQSAHHGFCPYRAEGDLSVTSCNLCLSCSKET